MRLLSALAASLAVLFACGPTKPPPTRELVRLTGTPYDRGLQHGTQLRSKVRSFYTTLLVNSLFPYLSREQPDISSLLKEYEAERYQQGRFAYELLLDSAKSVERTLPRAVREELQGVADGSGLTYDQVLVLNTFVDSVLATRGVALAIRLARSPTVESLELLGAETDGQDNDGDGQVDEAGEGTFSPFVPAVAALAVELPPDVAFRFVLKDPDGVDPSTVRLRLGELLYTGGAAGLTLEPLSLDRLRVTLRPPQGLPAGTVQSLVLGAGDNLVVAQPPPDHASFMRDEELVFTVRGAGLAPRDVRRPALSDGRTRPPALAFGVRGPGTADGQPLLGQHFALLDANTSHKHGAVFVHVPDSGPAFAVVGWAGVIYGFSGLSALGVGYTCNPSDTLDNSVVGSVLEQVADLSKAKLLAKGTPMGFLGRRMLERATDAASARAELERAQHVYGWSCIVADGAGGMAAVEVDSDVFKEGSNGVYAWAPGDVDASGRRYSSVRGDDVELGSAYARNVEDIASFTIAGQRVAPQRVWSSFFYRARRASDGLARRIDEGWGRLDADAAEDLLRDPEFVDKSDSMNAVVLELGAKRLRAAMGAVPATSRPFEVVDLSAEVGP